MMAINYKELFDNKLKERVEINSLTNYKADKVGDDLEELNEILQDIVEGIEGVESEYLYVKDEVVVGDSDTIKVKLCTDEDMRLIVSKRTIKFPDGNTAENGIEVNEDILEEYVIDIVDDEVVYDKGVNPQEKEQVFEYVIEAVAEMVADG